MGKDVVLAGLGQPASLSILDQDTDGDEKLRHKLPVNRADD